MPKLETPSELQEKNAIRKAERKAGMTAPTKTGNPIGRPKGGSLSVKKFNDLLESKEYDQANQALMAVATDPEHRHFASMQKLLQDRAAHMSHFEKAGAGSGQVAVNINISGLSKTEVDIEGEVVE
jgi:hypothetical protein